MAAMVAEEDPTIELVRLHSRSMSSPWRTSGLSARVHEESDLLKCKALHSKVQLTWNGFSDTQCRKRPETQIDTRKHDCSKQVV